jgi:hypothetical protein
MAMENASFLDEFSIKHAVIYSGESITTFITRGYIRAIYSQYMIG